MAAGFSTVNFVRHLTAEGKSPHNPAMPKDTSGAVQAEARRLTAIMFTDMVGFSRQMGADEYTRVDQHTARHLPTLSFGHRLMATS